MKRLDLPDKSLIEVILPKCFKAQFFNRLKNTQIDHVDGFSSDTATVVALLPK